MILWKWLFWLSLLLFLSAAAFAETASNRFSRDVYALRGPQDTSAKLYMTVVPADEQTTPPETLKNVQVKVFGTNGQLATTEYVNVPSPGGHAVVDLGDVPLHDAISVQVLEQTGQTVNTEVLKGTTAVTEFAVNPRRVVASDFEGFGGQMNMHLYTALNDPSRGFIGNLRRRTSIISKPR